MSSGISPASADNKDPRVRRSRTAIRRYRCSKPVAIAITDGVVSPKTTLFDYGCGHGGDVRYLSGRGIRASGWDPHFNNKQKLRTADVVNLGYVLNVIEDSVERRHTLLHAYQLAKSALVVSVRVDRALEEATEFADGLLTGAGTFQKIYSPSEFRDYLASSLPRRPYLVAPGIAYIFKDDEVEARYLATRAFTSRLEFYESAGVPHRSGRAV
jgi:DNA phosphorothioation-associated putative methyltransferase